MGKKFITGWIVLFVAWMTGDFVVHSVLLGPDYAQLPGLFRSPADASRYFPYMLLAHVLLAGAFTWIYARGVQARPWMAQGVRFGVATALLTVVPTYLIYYAVQPLPGALVARQIVFELILMVLLGILVAWLHRSRGEVPR
ncbi:MAG: hypothetical protein JSR36_00955 [Proteobacteria bacterium]|nr:hypothetical protein [Pseudomonadota bacterium]